MTANQTKAKISGCNPHRFRLQTEVVDPSEQLPPAEMAEDTDAEPALDAGIVQAIEAAVVKGVEGHLEAFQTRNKAVNHELATMRRRLKRATPEQADEHVETSTGNGQSNGNGNGHLSRDDVKALMAVGRLQTQVSESTWEGIQGLDLQPTQEAAILDAIIKGQSNQQASPGREVREINRATTSAARNSVPRPASQKEFFSLRKTDKRRYETLSQDPSFDPSALPYRS